MKRTHVGLFLLVILISIFVSASKIQHARASSPTIYVNPDGSITPSTANITSSDNVTYTFTGNNYLPIVVNRSSIIINGWGHMLQALGQNGFSLSGVSNVTIKNTTITNTNNGIYLTNSSGIVLSGNSITANSVYGIGLDNSSGNVLYRNSIVANSYGIVLGYSSDNNTLSGNNVANSEFGIVLYYSSDNNTLSGNNVTANSWYGISLASSSGNRIFHNDFLDNAQQALVYNSTNIWDNGYPSGGNYWSDYQTKYPSATENDSSGIWNTPYVIDVNNTDHYPLMNQPIIPEFQPFMLLPLFLIVALLAVAIYRKKPSKYAGTQPERSRTLFHHLLERVHY